jgi:acyl-CoA synthetase (AMP-forming)/AMP-acid ligase II
MFDGGSSVSLNVHLWCICLVQFVVVFIVVTRVRAIAAPLNVAYTEGEFKFYLEDAGSTLLGTTLTKQLEVFVNRRRSGVA